MKLCIGQAGMLSGVVFACGANSLNFIIWNQERESAILLHTPGTCTIHTLRLW